jgi:hypothetical protein
MRKISSVLVLGTLLAYSNAQVVINEASNRNFTQVIADDGNNYDWFELFNPGTSDISLSGWGMSDDAVLPGKWIFPDIVLKSQKHLLVFASGLNIKKVKPSDHWESAILPADSFHYLEPVESTPADWNSLGFDVTSWKRGIAGFGFGNDDDNTLTSRSSAVVYIRRNFTIPDTASVSDAVLHVDYDDGFVAYLNGIEISRSNVEGIPTWNSLASADHSAQMWLGNNPDKFELDMALLRSIWRQGENVFAIEVHNRRVNSSDLSLIPFLSFGISTNSTFFQPLPAWFSPTTGISLHTNFKIDSEGENLYLSLPEGIIADSLLIPRIPLNSSLGRVTDGASETGIFLTATPGASNSTSPAYTNGYEPSPQFSVPAGFYNSSLKVTITNPSATAVVRYTTDGSEPTETSFLYTGTPVSVTSTKTLKARSFSTIDKLPGNTTTATYFINASHVLPVISITTNNENLYGDAGIFDHWDQTWNKPCYIEYFDSEKNLIFKQEAGIQIDGGAGGSRSQPQHSVRIEPGNGTFGEGDVKYALIPDRPFREDYSSFYLRNGSNQYNTLQYKDGLQVKAVAKNTHTYYSAHTPIVAYINGGYFGVYELREKLNADFFTENYLMDNDSLDLLTLSYFKGSVLQALEGSTEQFWIDFESIRNLSPSDNAFLDQVSGILDLNNYTDYIIAQSWICNTDWPWNNIRAFRNKSTDLKWRYTVQDVEWAMSPNGWSLASTDHFAYMFGQDYNLPYIGYWLRLIQNENYRPFFINRFADLMNSNYLFANIGPMEEEIYNLQYPEMEAYFERWGNSTMTAFTRNHNTFRSQLESRSGYVRQHLQDHFQLSSQIEVTLDVQPAGAGQIKISTITPVSYPWQGIYFSDVPVKITALANPGYRFLGWDNNPLIENLNNPDFIVNMENAGEKFTANFEVSNEAFQGVTISEIHYKNGLFENTSDWIELYNAGESAVNIQNWYITDSDSANRFVFTQPRSIAANSRLIVARNTTAFAFAYPEVPYFEGPLGFKLGSPLDAVKLYDNANDLMAAVNYSDIFPWPLNGDESGRTLELKNPSGNLSDPENWFAGCIGGSPGTAFVPCPVISDIHQLEMEIPAFAAFPVPARDFMHVSIGLQKGTENGTLTIFDMLGNAVKIIAIGNIGQGNYTTTIDLSDMPEGILVLQFESEDINENIKIVHLK